jgi:electron transport complex protein RnfE
MLFGERFAGARWQVFPETDGWLLVLLPPGAFILLGLMLALGNARAATRRSPAPATERASAGVAP